ncbi:hypothetical protein Btru_073846 [Bulinus truncatus]|nr:hypothetical protein Btru_073846 [Bulinus truncatus]
MTSGTPVFWGSKDGYKSKKSDDWSNSLASTLQLIERDLTMLYDGLKTDDDIPMLTADTDDELPADSSLQDTCTKYVSHCEKIIALLSEPTNGTVKLSLGRLLGVVNRCLKVTHNDVHSIPSMMELAELLPTIHRSMFNVVSQLILCCRTILMPQCRLLIDMCLNALVSMTYMKHPSKSQTRSSIYNVLNVLIETLGWSGFLTSQMKTLTQELVLDIKLTKELIKQLQAPVADNKQDVFLKKKKKGKKKANKADSYSELTVSNQTPVEIMADNLALENAATVAALKLSRHALENVEFIFVENLMRCIIETTKTLHREGLPQMSSYTDIFCRKELYKTIFTCALVYLGPGCSRKNVITHFQMSNSALNLLHDGMFLDDSLEVFKTCKHMLTIWRLTSNINRPIVRKILPDDCTEKEDIMEVEREKEKVSEENELLRQRLLETEIENQRQSRLIAALQKELKEIKKKNAEEISILKDSSGEFDEEMSLIEDQSQEESVEANDFERSKWEDSHAGEKTSVSLQQPKIISDSVSHFTSENNNAEKSCKSSYSVLQTQRDGCDYQLKTFSKTTPLKRKLENDLSVARNINETKKYKNERSSTEQKSPETVKAFAAEESDSESLQAMISDFVDAEPDIL